MVQGRWRKQPINALKSGLLCATCQVSISLWILLLTELWWTNREKEFELQHPQFNFFLHYPYLQGNVKVGSPVFYSTPEVGRKGATGTIFKRTSQIREGTSQVTCISFVRCHTQVYLLQKLFYWVIETALCLQALLCAGEYSSSVLMVHKQ